MKIKSIEKYLNTFSVTSIYAVTLFVLWLGISPFIMKQVFSLPSNDSSLMYMPIFSNSKPVSKDVKIISGKPAKLSIPSLGIDKNIIDGFYNASNQSWNVYKYGVHYALPTNLANNKEGNTLLYGHNNEYVFGSLKDIKSNSIVEITTENNHKFTYRFSSKQDYGPENVSIFNYQGPPLLTLQTCSGPFNEIRSLYLFELESAI